MTNRHRKSMATHRTAAARTALAAPKTWRDNMANGQAAFPWQAYLRRGVITRRQFVKLTALFGTAAAAVSVLSEPEPAAAALAPANKQVLRYPDQEPLHFDPATMEARPEILIGMALFDPLITFDDSGRIVPLAARTWEVSKDELTYTFHCGPGCSGRTDTR